MHTSRMAAHSVADRRPCGKSASSPFGRILQPPQPRSEQSTLLRAAVDRQAKLDREVTARRHRQPRPQSRLRPGRHPGLHVQIRRVDSMDPWARARARARARKYPQIIGSLALRTNLCAGARDAAVLSSVSAEWGTSIRSRQRPPHRCCRRRPWPSLRGR